MRIHVHRLTHWALSENTRLQADALSTQYEHTFTGWRIEHSEHTFTDWHIEQSVRTNVHMLTHWALRTHVHMLTHRALSEHARVVCLHLNKYFLAPQFLRQTFHSPFFYYSRDDFRFDLYWWFPIWPVHWWFPIWSVLMISDLTCTGCTGLFPFRLIVYTSVPTSLHFVVSCTF